EAFVQSLDARDYVGANVTVPHKEKALAYSLADERALAVGAANTLWIAGGFLHATNTDVEGFLNNLDACAPQWDRDLSNVVVLGAGGAAHAVVDAMLTRLVWHITVVNRTPQRAEVLRGRFLDRLQVAPWQDLDDLLNGPTLFVPPTTLGMAM